MTTAKRATNRAINTAKSNATKSAKAKGEYGRQDGNNESVAVLEIKLAKLLLGLNQRFWLVTKGPNQVKRNTVGPKIPVRRPERRSSKKNPVPTYGQLANLLKNHFSNLYKNESLKLTKDNVSRTKIEITNLNSNAQKLNSTVLEITNLFL